MAFVAALSLAAYAASSAESGGDTWSKFLLTDAAAKTGAVCLDGTPGGGYLRRGSGNGVKKWIIFHQGGGWCSSDTNCAGRSLTALGSSKAWGPTYTDTYEGSELFDDKAFANWNVVYAMYCDGGSWTGNVTDPISAPPKTGAANVTIYYRGRRLLDALIDHLLEPSQGLASATDLLFGGCSAGGLTAYAHADYVASRMPRTVNTLAIADAMFALDSNSYKGESLFPARMQWGYKAWDSGPSLNQDCMKALGGADGSDGWKCMFGGVAAGFVQTPLFVVNSKYGTWQEKAIIGANGTITSPTIGAATKAFWVGYGNTMVKMLEVLPAQHGYFVSNCPAHCQTGTASSWTGMSIDGTIMGEAFVAWHQAHSTAAAASSSMLAPTASSTRVVERCNVTTCGSDVCRAKEGGIAADIVDPYLASIKL